MDEKRCPLSYERLKPADKRYSRAGLRRLSPRLQHLDPLPFTQEELLQEAAARMDKMSIGGVQPKLSAVLRVGAGRFELTDVGGRYIIKPQNPLFAEIPENEDVTMRMAAAAGVEVPVHGLIWTQENKRCYVIERFDRYGREGKRAVEDFAQLLGLSRETKYDASMEKVGAVLDDFATFPAVEKVRLFRRVVVAFLTGNEDMHVKNFSLLTDRQGITRLSPAYDLVNTTIVLAAPKDQLALPLAGKRSNLRRYHFVDYYGLERLGLTPASMDKVVEEIGEAQPQWDTLLDQSFLSTAMKERYADVLQQRRAILWS